MTNPEHTVRTNASGKRLAAQRRHHERAMDETVRDAPAVKRDKHASQKPVRDYGEPWAEAPTTSPDFVGMDRHGTWLEGCHENDRVLACVNGCRGINPAFVPEMLAQLKHCHAMATKLGDEKWAAEIRAVIVKAIGDVSW